MNKDIIAPPDRVAEFLLHPVAQGFLDSVSDGVLILDASDRRVVAMNRTARDLLDYEEGDVLGEHCADLMNSPACRLSCPLTAIVEGRPEDGELDLFYRGRGGDKLIHARTRMILVRDPQGEPLAGIEIFTDLRPIRELERRLGDRRSRGLGGGSPGMQRVFRRNRADRALRCSGRHRRGARRRQGARGIRDSPGFAARRRSLRPARLPLLVPRAGCEPAVRPWPGRVPRGPAPRAPERSRRPTVAHSSWTRSSSSRSRSSPGSCARSKTERSGRWATPACGRVDVRIIGLTSCAPADGRRCSGFGSDLGRAL